MTPEEDGQDGIEEQHAAGEESLPEEAVPPNESDSEGEPVSKAEVNALGQDGPSDRDETPPESDDHKVPPDLGDEGDQDLETGDMPEITGSGAEVCAGDEQEKTQEETADEGEPDREPAEEPAVTDDQEIAPELGDEGDQDLETADIPEIPRSSAEVSVEGEPVGGEEEVADEQKPVQAPAEAPAESEEEETFPAIEEGDEDLDLGAIPDIPESSEDVSAHTTDEEETEEEAAGEREPSPPAPDETRADVAPETDEEPAEAQASKRRIRIPLPSRKVTVSVAAGIVAGLFVAGWLTTHRVRQAADVADSDVGFLTPLDQAKELIDDGKYGAARRVLEEFLEKTPESAERSEGLFLLAEAIEALQDKHPTETGYTEAREAYRKAIEADPSSPRVPNAMKNIARTYLAEDMFQEARDEFEKIVREHPTLPDVVELEFEIAKTYLSQGDSSAATRKLTALITDYPDSGLIPDVKLALGTALEHERRNDKASALYRQLLKSFPQHRLGAEAQERLGDMAFAEGKHDEAVALYSKRVEMGVALENNDRVMLKLARAYGAMGDWEASTATCRNLLELFKKSELEPEAIIQLCLAEEKRGRVEAAIRHAFEGRTKFPENPKIVKCLADLHFLKEDYSEAARLYDEAVKVEPDDREAWFRGGEAHFKNENLESSYRDFREVTRRFPSDPLAYDAYLRLADVLYMRGEPQRAIDLLSSRLPEHIVSARRDPILLKMAELYLDLGLPGPAAETYAAMLDGVDDDEIQARMGIAALQAERWETGLRALRGVDRSRIPPDLAYAAFVEMGVALRGFGDLRGAVEALETSVNGYPAHRDARGVTALLRTYLAANKVAEARKLEKEIESWTAGRAERAAVSAQASLVWGDYLFSRGDYLNALEEFAKLAANESVPPSIKEWASYQRSNAYFELARYDESQAAYQDFLENYPASSWKKAAQTRLDLAKLEMRLRKREF